MKNSGLGGPVPRQKDQGVAMATVNGAQHVSPTMDGPANVGEIVPKNGPVPHHRTPKSIFIPVRESDEGVEVFVDELPEDVNDLIDVLKAETAPLDIWLQFAVRKACDSTYRWSMS